MFIGTRGATYNGDIAIDDVALRSCDITPLCDDKDFMCLDIPK